MKLLQLEWAGKLGYGDWWYCSECWKSNCCYEHRWVNRKWWENARPYIDKMRRMF